MRRLFTFPHPVKRVSNGPFEAIQAQNGVRINSPTRHHNTSLTERYGRYPVVDGLEGRLRGILNEGPGATKTVHRVEEDRHGTRWVILDDGNFEDLTNSVYTVGNAITHEADANLLIAAVWGTHYAGSAAYWLYTYQRRTFYPFIPRGTDERDHPNELALSRLMGRQGMAIERSTEHWYPLWGIPF